jgi:hypothetical protein
MHDSGAVVAGFKGLFVKAQFSVVAVSRRYAYPHGTIGYTFSLLGRLCAALLTVK